MSGRTERVNARDLLDRADAILFETEAARSWLEQLVKRAEGTLSAAKKNKVMQTEFKTECSELNKAVTALDRATNALEAIAKAVERREKL
jgi:exonuclease VII small subunit